MASSSSSSSISTSISTSILSSSILSSTESSLPHKHHHTHDNEKAKYYLSKFRNIILQSSSNLQIRLIEPILYFQGNPEESLGSHKNRNELCEECELINHNWTFLPSPTANSLLHPSSSLQDNNYLLPAGIYTYPFELFLPGTLPETIQAQLGNVSYKLQATVIKAKLSPNLHTSHHVTIIRDLSEESNSQGIAISRDWLGLINFEITIPNKAYSIGDSINIDFKTIPQVKRVQVIGLRIELNEQSIYRSRVPIKSKMTGNFTNKFKKEVIEIDVPITLLSCRCADNLPQYDESWSNLNQDYSHNLNDLPPAYETSIADKRRTTNLSVINESIINTSINNSIQRHSFHQ
ncbi:11294_t:CDS:2 [Rhizophagus irregularis]|nr:11294_t:CDS:2 [Rhizophagus irregularis]